MISSSVVILCVYTQCASQGLLFNWTFVIDIDNVLNPRSAIGVPAPRGFGKIVHYFPTPEEMVLSGSSGFGDTLKQLMILVNLPDQRFDNMADTFDPFECNVGQIER